MGYPAWTNIVTVLLLGALFFVGMYFVVQFSKRLQRFDMSLMSVGFNMMIFRRAE